jgi:hypothetical protein
MSSHLLHSHRRKNIKPYVNIYSNILLATVQPCHPRIHLEASPSCPLPRRTALQGWNCKTYTRISQPNKQNSLMSVTFKFICNTYLLTTAREISGNYGFLGRLCDAPLGPTKYSQSCVRRPLLHSPSWARSTKGSKFK